MVGLFSLSGGRTMRLRHSARSRLIFGLLAFSLVSGCNRPLEVQEPPLTQARIRKLAPLCRKYMIKQKKKPGSIEELKAWVKKLSPTEQSELAIDDPETAFVSPRDNQPF